MTLLEIKQQIAAGAILALNEEVGKDMYIIGTLTDEQLAKEIASQDNPDNLTVEDLRAAGTAYGDLVKMIQEWAKC